MAESVDAGDSKSLVRKDVQVQVLLSGLSGSVGMVDNADLKSVGGILRAGSSPAFRTMMACGVAVARVVLSHQGWVRSLVGQ